MNMNKKVLKFLSLFISLFIFNLNVNAACSDVYNTNPYPTEEQCQKFTEDNFKCKGNGYTGGMVSKLRCEKSNECAVGYVNSGNSCVIASSNNNANNGGTNNANNNSNTNNGTATKKNCTTFDKQTCVVNRDCEWTGSNCIDAYVASNPCGDKNVKVALRFIGYLLMIARVAIPLIIIVMGIFDLFKSVIDKDEKSLTKQVKILLMRVVAGVFVFFIPTIVYALFNVSNELKIVNDTEYMTCVDCLLKPTNCSIDKK